MEATVETTFRRRMAGLVGSLLLVEDNEDDFVLARYELQRLKITNPIRRVATTAQMLDYLGGFDQFADREQYPFPAVIFVDMRLPDSSGLNAQAMIRSNINYRDIPLVVISGGDRVTWLRSAVALGANGYMVKPFCGKHFARILLDQDIRLQIASVI